MRRTKSKTLLLVALIMLPVLSACSHAAVGTRDHATVLVSVKTAAPTQAHAANGLQKQVEQMQAIVQRDRAAIPALLGQSDASLKQAQSLLAKAKNTKDAKSKKMLLANAGKVQAIADSQAQSVVTMKQDIDIRLATIALLEQQMKLQDANAASKNKAAGAAGSEPSQSKRSKRIASRRHSRA